MQEKNNIKNIYSLSPMQEGMLFHSLLDEHGGAYVEQALISLQGALEPILFKQAFQRLVERYDIMRTVFVYKTTKRPRQVVLEKQEVEFNFEDIENISRVTGGPGDYIEDFIKKDKARGFDLTKGPLMRLSLFKIDSGSWRLIWSFHHILIDGWCLGILYSEFMQLYRAARTGTPLKFEPVIPYSRYIQWLEKQDKQKGLEYWQALLEGYERPASLPRPGDSMTPGRYLVENYRVQLDESLTRQLRQVAMKNQVTENTVFQAAWGILLQRYTNTGDVVFGAVVSGRPAEVAGSERMIGLFINTVPVRIKSDTEPQETFSGLLKKTQHQTSRSKSYEYLSLAEIQAGSSLKNRLIDHILTFQNISLEENKKETKDKSRSNTEITVEDMVMLQQTNYNLNLSVFPSSRFLVEFAYNRSVYEPGFIKKVAGQLTEILRQAAADPDIRLKDIDILSPEDIRQLLVDFNQTAADWPKDKTLHRLFEEQAARTPDNIAVEGCSTMEKAAHSCSIQISYRELNEQSHRLTYALKEKGAEPDVVAAIEIERSVEMIMAILGILKAGGAYMPIDPNYPRERSEFMLRDSSAKILVTTPTPTLAKEGEKERKWEAEKNIKILFLDTHYKKSSRTSPLADFPLLPDTGNPQRSTSLAYIIYTSGTTGRPKGTIIEHRNVVRLMFNEKFQFDFTGRDIWTMFHSYCFDFSVWEMYGALLYGGKLIMIPPGIARDSRKYLEVLKKKKVTILNQTPSAFYNLLNLELIDAQKELSIRYVIFGGEALTPQRLKAWHAKYPGTKLINMYGITETTVHVTFKELKAPEIESPVSNIGRAIPTLRTYIIDKNVKLLPLGAPGELCIGGEGVGRGYLNRPELTNEKFVNNPFNPGERIYRTGDLSRLSENGDIEYLGRIDNQVKIRGFRIESGEIENRLSMYTGIVDAVVISRENNSGDKYLCAYFVSVHDIPAAELREHLLKYLPGYMVPAYFTRIDKIPLNANGKLDRKVLPEPEIKKGMVYLGPRNSTEEKLVAIWAEVLARDEQFVPQLRMAIGIDNNFFELGGHSLKATILIYRIYKEFGVQISLVEFFNTPTIIGLVESLQRTASDKFAPIEATEKREYYALSSAQKRLYLLQQLLVTGTAYNLPYMLSFAENINIVKLEETFRKLIARHESLSTSFETITGMPVQKIHHHVEFTIKYYDLTAGDTTKAGDYRTPKAIINDFIRAFDLSKAPLLRVGLIKEEETKSILMIDMHHIITDGISQDILVRDFMSLYAEKKLPLLGIQYKDYSEWQQGKDVQNTLKKQANFWLMEFADTAPVLNMPGDYPRPATQQFEGNIIDFALDSEETKQIKEIAQTGGITLFMAILAIYNIFLAKLTSQEDLVVGAPIAGRRYADLEKIVGMFVNTLALRNFPSGEKTFKLFLREIKEKTINAFENQDYPFEDLVEKIGAPRDMSRNPLFDTAFVFQNFFDLSMGGSPSLEKMGDLKIKPYRFERRTSKFDLTLIIIENEINLYFSFEYCTHLFNEETILRFIGYFKKIISSIISDPEKKILDIEVISAEEKKKILYDFNDTQSFYPGDKTLGQLFKEQVEQTPDHIAVVFSHEAHKQNTITYKELNHRSDILACVLREKGVAPGMLVGIKIERTIDMIIGIMGILKAMAAYLPISPSYPPERITFMLKDSAATHLLTADDFQGDTFARNKYLPVSWEEQVNISSLQDMYTSNLAYIIYTSGSTGRPKGVMVEHRNVIRLVKNTEFLEFKTNDRILQTGALEFDASTFEIWGALLNGLTLVLTSHENILDPGKLKQMISVNQITTMWLTSALFNQSIQCDTEIFTGLRNLLVGGDVLSSAHINRIRRRYPRLNIINGYGPTENTTFSTTFPIDKEYKENIPIGKPITNSTAYVVDKWFHLQPTGLAGELWVGGDGVSRGYLNNPELTAGKFINGVIDHFSAIIPSSHKIVKNKNNNDAKSIPGTSHSIYNDRFYRTGDWARWLPDGNIEFLGRIDDQVKIRGFRIEPREIADRLSRHEHIDEAVVLGKKISGGDTLLCAYFVSPKPLRASDLRAFLLQDFPDYMIPSYFIRVENFPLTPNGKIDWRLLPEPGTESLKGCLQGPRYEIEEKMVSLWSEVLNIEKSVIGIDSDFFELGGHSLKAALLAAKIHKVFNAPVPLAEIFTFPTIRGLANYVKESTQALYRSIEPAEKKEYYPLTSAQKRLYILNQIDKKSIGYNIPSCSILEGDIHIVKLENTFRQLIQRHESLRTSFMMVNDEPAQKIDDAVSFQIEYYHQEQTLETIIKNFIRPFDLTGAPLLRVGLGRESRMGNPHGQTVLMIDMHHIISDGTSMTIAVKDFMTLYNEIDLPRLNIHYKDFSEWRSSRDQDISIMQQESFWLDEFSREIPVINLPTDYLRPVVQGFEGAVLNFEIDRGITSALKTLAFEKGVTLYMLLLSFYTILLAKLSNQEDIAIGTPVAGRKHADLEKIIGMFINTLALRNYPCGEKMFGDFLAEVKEKTLKAFENQDYPYETLVDRVVLNRDVRRNPLFDTMFVLQNMDTVEIDIPGLKLSPYPFSRNTSKFDLTLSGVEKDDILLFTIEYSTKLFKRETVERFTVYFKKTLSGIIDNSKKDTRISEIEIIPGEEKKRILFDFNNTQTQFAEDKTIHALFEEQAARTPDRIANQSSSSSLTYSMLKQRSNLLRQNLQVSGVKPGDVVGIMMERSLEMIVGILGILKTGSAYLPINPRQPEARTKYMMKDSNAILLLTDQQSNHCETVETILSTSERNDINHLVHFAYIIYTSGSTGNPKGVPVTHSNFSPLIHWGYKHLGINEKDRVIQNLSYYFDWSVWEIFITLTTGASLYMIREDILLNPGAEVDFILEKSITVLHITPTHYGYLLDIGKNLKSLKFLFIGAEKLTIDLARRSILSVNEGCRVFNMYGPTEATIIASVLEIDRTKIGRYNTLSEVPIGRPAANLELLVLDNYMNMCPIGVTGELYIIGGGVTSGYLNNPSLTNEKFKIIPGKISWLHHITSLQDSERVGGVLYKTGDHTRWTADGNIEYLGRIDSQVKIRGYRIEPGEIENHLRTYPGIKDSLVICRDESGRKYLCAYLVPEQTSEYEAVQAHKLKEFLAKKLPDYMIPACFVKIEHIPLNPGGKLNVEALPQLIESDFYSTSVYEAPETNIQRIIAETWQEVLGREKVGIRDNFFDLGGNSLDIVKVAAKLKEKIGKDIPVVTFFTYASISSLEHYLTSVPGESPAPGSPVDRFELIDESKNLMTNILQLLDKEGD